MESSKAFRIFPFGLALCLLAESSPLIAQDFSRYIGRRNTPHRVGLTRLDSLSQHLDFNLGDYSLENIHVDGQDFTKLKFSGGVRTSRKGFAELPYLHAAIHLPLDRKVKLVVENETHEDIILDFPMLPSRGIIYRDQNPGKVPYRLSADAEKGGFHPAELFTASEPYFFRDVKGCNVYFHPFQYNASSKTLRVTRSLTLRLEDVQDEANRELMYRTTNRGAQDMDTSYRSLLMNYQPNTTRWTNEVGEVGDILVITTAAYKEAIAPYVTWKREKGFNVKVVEVAKGTNVKSLVQSEYNANNKLLYVQLVGGWADIQSEVGTSQSKPMDPMLGCVVGNDSYPDLIVGRFSAATAADVTAQVSKVIKYEKSPEASATWYKSALEVASSQGLGMGDDGESDIQHATAIRDGRLKPYGYSKCMDAFGDNTPNATMLSSFNAGVSVLNYTGHGNESAWGTCNFTAANAAALKNGSKLPVVCSVACLVGSLSSPTGCLAEALLRNPNGGAIAGMFSTTNQPWQPPMRGQDYFNDMLVGGHTYSGTQAGISTTGGKSIFGAMAVNACVLMYAESNQVPDLETIQSWALFGDASLQVRSAVPKAIVLSSEKVDISSFTTLVTSGGSPVSGALVSLSKGEQVFSGFTDVNGNITLSHGLSGTVKLVVTAQNAMTVYKEVAVSSGAVEPTPVAQLSIATQPQNQTVKAGDTVTFSVTASGGTSPYTFAWFKNGVQVSGAAGNTCSFTSEAADNNAQIYVVITDSKQQSIKSSIAALTIAATAVGTDLIVNGDFEQGSTGWSGATSEISNWSRWKAAYSGVKIAWLGNWGRVYTEKIYQTVTIPATAKKATLSFYVAVVTDETTKSTAFDKLMVQVGKEGYTPSKLLTLSNLDAAVSKGNYLLKQVDLTSYKGQKVVVSFYMSEDEDYETSFYLDAVSLKVE